MGFNLSQAINDGLELQSKIENDRKKEQKEKQAKDKERYNSNLIYWRKKLSENNFLQNMITEAISKGLSYTSIDGGYECAEIINKEYDGLSAKLKCDQIRYADDMPYEDSYSVQVTWRRV